MRLEPGTTISHYKILSEIGKGGMGEVYLAGDTKLDRKVAIKFLSEEFVNDSDKLNRFVQEAKAASALNHPNIITIHEIGETDGSQYIALEYIEGETLTERLKQGLDFKSALDIATQIASALDAAHSAGIVHRDIKPDNVMVREDGLVKILDFGIAKLSEPRAVAGGMVRQPEKQNSGEDHKTLIFPSPSPSDPASPKTMPGMIIGSANYMSPEQAKGKEIDARTDIFSFGVLLYEMVAGDLPFEGDGPMEIIAAIINKEPRPLDQTGIPDEVVRTINKALRKNPEKRYQTIKGLLADLNDVKEELKFQDKLDKTVKPVREDQDTQVFKATTAVEAGVTAAAGTNDSISIKKSSFSKGLMAAAAVIVIAVIGLGYWYFSDDDQIDSIAVMPFVNESGDKEVEYLSDGMTETLISSLTEIPNLSVKARSSVFYYKGKNASPKQIGEELNVEAVLLGRVTQRGEDLKLNLELVSVQTQDVIWSDLYNRKKANLVTLQTEIARDVVRKLKTKLSSADEAKLTKTYTADPEAYEDYLRGRYYWNKRDAENFRKAIEEFKSAADKDPNYALAYVGLADCYVLLPYYESTPSSEILSRAKAYAERALKIDDTLGEAHTSLAFINTSLWNWKEAEANFKRAIELSPSYPTAHHWYGDYLRYTGQVDAALIEYKKAEKLDPLSQVITSHLADTDWIRGDVVSAINHIKKTIDLDPNWATAHQTLSLLYLEQRRYSESLAEGEKSVTLSKRASSNLSALGFVYARINEKPNDTRAVIKELEDRYRNNQANGHEIALVYAGLGEKDQAFAWLEKDMQSRNSTMALWLQSPIFSSLRDDARYKDLIKRIDFPENK